MKITYYNYPTLKKIIESQKDMQNPVTMIILHPRRKQQVSRDFTDNFIYGVRCGWNNFLSVDRVLVIMAQDVINMVNGNIFAMRQMLDLEKVGKD